jgi:DNA-binding GntR family transcriptional regulator
VASGALQSVEWESADPLYVQVQRAITDEIARGTYRPGDRLPTERALCDRFSVSRVTLRRALRALAEDGILNPSQGRGWFVATGPLSEPPNALLSFTEMAAALGLVASARIVHAGVRPATIDEAEALRIAPGADLFHIQRVRLLDGVPIAVDESRVPLNVAPSLPDEDLTTGSLYATLARHGVEPIWAEFTVLAEQADPRCSRLLGLEAGEPLLVARQTTYDAHDRPIELGHMRYRGDRYRFRATLARRR